MIIVDGSHDQRITTSRWQEWPVISLSGSIEVNDTLRLRGLLDDALATDRRVIVSLTDTDYVSEEAAAVLATSCRHARDQELDFVVVATKLPPVLNLIRFDKVATIAPSFEAIGGGT